MSSVDPWITEVFLLLHVLATLLPRFFWLGSTILLRSTRKYQHVGPTAIIASGAASPAIGLNLVLMTLSELFEIIS